MEKNNLNEKYPIGFKELENSNLKNSWEFLTEELKERVLKDLEQNIKLRGAKNE